MKNQTLPHPNKKRSCGLLTQCSEAAERAYRDRCEELARLAPQLAALSALRPEMGVAGVKLEPCLLWHTVSKGEKPGDPVRDGVRVGFSWQSAKQADALVKVLAEAGYEVAGRYQVGLRQNVTMVKGASRVVVADCSLLAGLSDEEAALFTPGGAA